MISMFIYYIMLHKYVYKYGRGGIIYTQPYDVRWVSLSMECITYKIYHNPLPTPTLRLPVFFAIQSTQINRNINTIRLVAYYCRTLLAILMRTASTYPTRMAELVANFQMPPEKPKLLLSKSIREHFRVGHNAFAPQRSFDLQHYAQAYPQFKTRLKHRDLVAFPVE